MSPIPHADFAADFALAASDWSDAIAVQAPSIARSDSGTETITLGAAVDVVGVWQALSNNAAAHLQEALGLQGRPRWLILVPSDTSIDIGDVCTHTTPESVVEVGEVMAATNWPGHIECVLKERQ
jgi:hypothetical protein